MAILDHDADGGGAAGGESWLGPKGSRKRAGLQIGIALAGLLFAFLVYRSSRSGGASTAAAADPNAPSGYNYPVTGPGNSGSVGGGDGSAAGPGAGVDTSGISDAINNLAGSDTQGFSSVTAGLAQVDTDTLAGLQQVDQDTQTGLGQVDTDTQAGLSQLNDTINQQQQQITAQTGLLGQLTGTLGKLGKTLTRQTNTIRRLNKQETRQQQAINGLRKQLRNHPVTHHPPPRRPSAHRPAPHAGAKAGFAHVTTPSPYLPNAHTFATGSAPPASTHFKIYGK